MKAEWLAFLSAVQFLTRLPVPDPGWDDGRLDRAAKWFPLVGALVGAICGGIFWIASMIWIPGIAIVLSVLAAILVTGALHEDGLADTADGLGGAKDRARRLEIMRDSRIGTYGLLALLFCIPLRMLGYGMLPDWRIHFPLILVFIAAHVVSRACMTIHLRSQPYARTGGAGASLTGGTSSGEVAVVALSVLFAVLVIPALYSLAIFAAGLLSALVATLFITFMVRRTLGGWTGDTAGATQQISEVAFLLGVAAWI